MCVLVYCENELRIEVWLSVACRGQELARQLQGLGGRPSAMGQEDEPRGIHQKNKRISKLQYQGEKVRIQQPGQCETSILIQESMDIKIL
jgi:hypothetical protein